MKNFLGLLCILFIVSCTATAQPYKSHTVEKGETVESIAKRYNIKPEDIIKLNPEARRGIRKNNVLVIPSKSIKSNKKVNVTFIDHKVRKKETLYSISKKYDVSIADIKKYNEKVAKEGLKKGERIVIPQYADTNEDVVSNEKNTKDKDTDKDATVEVDNETEYETYIIKPKETKWGIAHSYGMTIKELESLNPEIRDGLKIGQEIKLPIRDSKPQVPSSEKYAFYTVKPKQTVYTLTRKLNVSEDELILLNPALKDGLKSGMVLKLPVDKAEDLEMVGAEIIDTFNFLEEADTDNVSNVVIMLPFKLNEMNMDSVGQTKEKLKKDRLLKFATEFYTGQLIALDSIKQLGFSVNVKVYDNQGSKNSTKQIVTENDFSDVHAVIGPILATNIEVAAEELKADGIPVISPLTSREVNFRNVYQTIPSKELLQERMLEFMEDNGQDKNIIIIADKSKQDIKAKLMNLFPDSKEVKVGKGNYIQPASLTPLLSEEKVNWVILETDELSLIANATSVLNSYNTSSNKIVLLTTDRSDNYDNDENVYNSHLASLNFHYPTIDKSSDFDNSFNKKYEKRFKISPSRIATRGFDITFDILLRLAYDQNLAKSVRSGAITSFVENRFDYDRKLFGGFYNKGVYIVKYDGLRIKEVRR